MDLDTLRDVLHLLKVLWKDARTADVVRERLGCNDLRLQELLEIFKAIGAPCATISHEGQELLYLPVPSHRHGPLPSRTSCTKKGCDLPPATSMYCVIHQRTRERLSPPTGASDEQWRPVHFDPTYEVSNYGRVRSLRKALPRLLQIARDPNGLTIVDLGGSYADKLSTSKTHPVARLVLQAFEGPPPTSNLQGRWVAHHRDGNSANNRLTNLEWTQQREEHHPKRRRGRSQ